MKRKGLITWREGIVLLSLLLIAGVSFTKHMFISTQTSFYPSTNTTVYSRVLAPAQTSNASYALGCIREKVPEESRVKPARMMLSLPQSFDWTQQSGYNWMTPIRNQLSCGSCVAFGSIGALEGQTRIQANNPSWNVDLSEQHLFSCGDGSCTYGWYISASLNYLTSPGTPDELCMPYQAKDSSTLPCSSTCSDWQSRAFKIRSWHWTSTSPADIQAALLNGPLVAAFDVYYDFFAYTGGIYHHTSGTYAGGHCITIVGYDATQNYWKCKNSWGPSWGESGYFKIGFEECNIEQSVAAIEAAITTVTFYTDPSSVGSISADGVTKTNEATGAYRTGVKVHMVANPASGYTFDHWETSGVSVDSPLSQDTQMTPSANGWLKVHFKNTCQITVSSNPVGSGFVAVDGAPVTTPWVFIWIQGSTHSLAANSPVSGGAGIQYVWTSWSDGGAQSHTITVPSSPATYTANFKKQYLLTVLVSPSGEGFLTVSTGWRDEGVMVSATATANSGYSFYYWSLDGVNMGSNPSISFAMNSPRGLTAIFRSTSSLSFGSSAGSISLGSSVTLSGTVTPTQPSPGIPAGTTVILGYSLAGGSWNTFIMTHTGGGGTYSVTWHPPYPGVYQIKASWDGNSNYEGAISGTISLNVTGVVPPGVTLVVSGPSSASRGGSATFEIFVDNRGSTLSATLYLEIVGPGGYRYFDFQQIVLGEGQRGRYQFSWQIPSGLSTGQYNVSVGLIPPKPTAATQTVIAIV